MKTALAALARENSPGLLEWLHVVHPRPNEWFAGKHRPVVIFTDLERVIEASKSILALPPDWDEAGSPAFRQETWSRAITLLRAHAEALYDRYGLVLETPRILPGPNGSIDLHWKTRRRELLLNVPEAPEEPSSYYGDDFGSERRKGVTAPGALDMDLFSWLAVTD